MGVRHIGVCTWSLQPEGPDQLIQAVQALPVDGVQLAVSPVLRDPDAWSGIVDRLAETGRPVLSGMMEMVGEDYTTPQAIARTGGVRPDETWPANLEHAREVAAFAARHQVRLVTFHAGFIPPGGRDDGESGAIAVRQRMIERLHTIADVFSDHGVEIGLETGQESAAALAELLDELDAPNVGVNFDPANMILYGSGDALEAMERLLPRICQYHVKDALVPSAAGSWGTEVPIGLGAVDWSRFFTIANRDPRQLDAIIEREAGDDRMADVRLGCEIVRMNQMPSMPSDHGPGAA